MKQPLRILVWGMMGYRAFLTFRGDAGQTVTADYYASDVMERLQP